MKPAVLLAFALTFVAAVPVPAADEKERLHEGVRLHDQGDYEGAMAIYRSLLEEHPHDRAVVYELAFSWVESGKDLEALTKFIDAELASGVEQDPLLFRLLGWAHDGLGAYAKGEAAFRRALESRPDEALSHYNLGVNLVLQQRYDDAIASLLESARRNPAHASTWFALAGSFQGLNRSVPALYASARGVALEPTSPRGKEVAGRLWGLLFSGVEVKAGADATKSAGKEINITIPFEVTGKEGGEAGPPELRMTEVLLTSVAASARFNEPWDRQSDAAFFAHSLHTLAGGFAAMDDFKKDPFWKLTLPWFEALSAAGHGETLGYVLLSAGGNADASRWAAQHVEAVGDYFDWLARTTH